MKTNAAFRRILKMQRQIHKTIRADVRKALGPQSAALRRYYEAYKKEFRGPARNSSKPELLKACQRADVILLGDYHTFAQSQRAALRLLRELVVFEEKLTLGLELVPSRYQGALDDFLAEKLSESEFLEAIDYEANWGFRWEQFKPLFDFARNHRLPVLALNHESRDLAVRDERAGELLAAYAARNPKAKLFVLYGDLHLARGHIPKFLRQHLKKLGTRRRVLTVFQNSEALYWRLAEGGMAHSVDVVALGRDRFCIMNAAPWVKLQSYLEWAERSELYGTEEGSHEDDAGVGPNLHELAHERLRHLAEALSLTLPDSLDFTIQTVNDLSFVTSAPGLKELKREELKIVKYHILGNRSLFVPGANLIYLASPSVNALSEGVALLAHAALSGSRTLFYDPGTEFFAAVLNQAIAYFGSKVLNHKRKCDLEEDYRLLLEQPLGRGALPQEKLQRRAAKLILRHAQAQREFLREDRYRGPTRLRGPGSIPAFLEAARGLGAILGEKLYASFVEGRYPSVKIERLFRSQLDGSRATRKLYLTLVSELHRAPLAHTSKQDLL